MKFTDGVQSAYEKVGLSDNAKNRKIIEKFALKYRLIHFKSLLHASSRTSIARSITSNADQRDSNVCIGTHDDYDIVFLQRQSTARFPDHPAVDHNWNIMQFDLHSHSDLPFIFIGTKHQSKTFYARLFSMKREVRHIDPNFYTSQHHFSAHYTIIASPAEQVFLAQLLSSPVTTTMAKHQLPFAIEIQGDSLFVIAQNAHTSLDSLTKMMHYGLWLARHIDRNIK